MILGKGFFITPSDSVAMIAANAQAAIPYFKSGPKASLCHDLLLVYPPKFNEFHSNSLNENFVAGTC
jgi:hypothetical protein